jgi:hypothetical protein
MATFANITVYLGTNYSQPFYVLSPTNEPYTSTEYAAATYTLQVTNGPNIVIPSTSWTSVVTDSATGLVTMSILATTLTSLSVAVGVYDYTFGVTFTDGTAATTQASGKFIVNSQTASNVATPNTSWTFSDIPSIGELVLYAFYLCGVRATQLTQEHMQSARIASILMIGRWNTGVNLWAIDLQTITIGEGLQTYNLPSNTVAVLDAYMTNSSGQNRIITPLGRSEFAAIANPDQTGPPTSFWFDRLLSPTINFWPVPDGTEPTMSYYRIRQIQDPGLSGGKNLEAPIYFLEPFALGLAQRLSLIWAPERTVGLKALYDEAKKEADDQNIEQVNYYISPSLSSYYRP